MSWITAIWSAAAGLSLAIALVHLLIWSHDRRSWANLCFFISVLGVLGLAICELITMYSETPEVFGQAGRWAHLVYAIGVFGSLGFIHFYFGTGRPWLLASALALRVLVVVADFTTGVNLHFTVVRSLEKVTFLGEQVSVAGDWIPNPWLRLGVLASLMQLAYVADAAIRLWGTGSPASRGRAVVVGGAVALAFIAASSQAALVAAGVLRGPFIVSFPFLGVVLAMGYELSRDVLRAAQLGRELGESERRLSLATEAANLGIWIHDLPRDEIWASAKWRELLGFTKFERLDLECFLQRLHRDDRERIREAFTQATQHTGHYEEEYRVMLPNGQIRWIASRGNVEFSEGQAVLRRGASLDITRRKEAEEAAQSLSGRLIDAQETERKRLARELHDDLSQNLAFLAVELDIFGQKPPVASNDVSKRMQELSTQVRNMSSSVHRLSHELHPAKLEQLGLMAAVRGFCRDFSSAHNVAIEFVPHDVPRSVPDDIALCLYRVVQEGLQNVVKHSGATSAKVELSCGDSELCLVVSDRGRGFDSSVKTHEGSLGLISMRERVRLVRGRISVQSRKGEGTRIMVQVPLDELDRRPAVELRQTDPKS
jgi:two-component system, LuxR family, sensor kinase FixL